MNPTLSKPERPSSPEVKIHLLKEHFQTVTNSLEEQHPYLDDDNHPEYSVIKMSLLDELSSANPDLNRVRSRYDLFIEYLDEVAQSQPPDGMDRIGINANHKLRLVVSDYFKPTFEEFAQECNENNEDGKLEEAHVAAAEAIVMGELGLDGVVQGAWKEVRERIFEILGFEDSTEVDFGKLLLMLTERSARLEALIDSQVVDFRFPKGKEIAELILEAREAIARECNDKNESVASKGHGFALDVLKTHTPWGLAIGKASRLGPKKTPRQRRLDLAKLVLM